MKRRSLRTHRVPQTIDIIQPRRAVLRYWFSLCLCACFLLAESTPALSQVPGRWQGTAEVNGKPLLILFDISSPETGVFSATMDVPAQGAKGLPCDEVKSQGDSLFITIKMIGGRYLGRFNADRSATTGTLRQGNFTTALDLKRTGDALALNRPQTPKPPFPYASEDVEYDNPDKTVHLGATLTLPAGAGPFPAAILISGSGAQDRNSTLFGHKPFWVIADYLTRRGIAVLRVDDRNVGQSTGPAQGTSADFAQDVITSLEFLKNRKDIDPKKIGLIGHSEGGMLAPMVAVERPKDVAFIVSLAGPGEKITDLMVQQNVATLKSMKVSDPIAEGYGTMMGAMIGAASTEPDTASAYQKATTAFYAWRATVHPNVAAMLTGVADSSGVGKYIRTVVNSLRKPWERYFYAYDPTDNLTRLTCPVLALNGGKDIQVLAGPNLAGWETTLKKAGNKHVTVQELPGLNHLFQHCTTCTVAEYGELTETFDPEVLKLMTDWITAVVLP
ncbi:alpha/beta hydrolase family protein [Salmonirosea aquatica]